MRGNRTSDILLLFLASAVLGSLGSDLRSKLVAAAPKAQPSLGQFVQYIRTFAFSDRLDITTNQVSRHVGVAKSFNLFDGSPITGRRLLPFIDPNAATNPFFGQLWLKMQGVYRIAFTQFKDLSNLKFGAMYHKIHTEKSIAAPGNTYFKSTAVIAKKTDDQIAYRTAYGWTGGNGIQQNTVTTQRECKSYFFFKKCKDLQVVIPRGLLPHEFQLVTEGLENLLYTALANKVSSTRLLRLSNLGAGEKKTFDVFQSLVGVEKSQLLQAISSLIEDSAAIGQKEMESLLGGEEVVVQTTGGSQHTVKILSETDVSFDVKVWTIKTQ